MRQRSEQENPNSFFLKPSEKAELEEGLLLTPNFDANGLIACIACDTRDGEVLMLAYMNAEALKLTLETGVAHYWSRSRQCLWRKGDSSGQIQTVKEIRTDCDQDALLLLVEPGGDGGACHTGRKSCFYRKVDFGPGETGFSLAMVSPG